MQTAAESVTAALAPLVANVCKQLAQERAEAKAGATWRDAALEAADGTLHVRLLQAEAVAEGLCNQLRETSAATMAAASQRGG